MTRTREIHLVSRPSGWPEPANFALVEVDLPDPGPGQVLIRNTVMSVEPYMRGRMNADYEIPPFQIGRALDGHAIGVVISSNAAQIAVGTTVLHEYGWREHALVDAAEVRVLDPLPGVPVSAYLGVLGLPGLAAYVGLLDIAKFAAEDVVFVSGAAGSVGSLVGQIARVRGASRVIGSAGSAAKVAYLTTELGFDAAFDHHDGDITGQLAAAAPDGIDVYFDNVGRADHFEAAITAFNNYGRVALCGAVAGYNDQEPAPGPRNLAAAIGKRLTLQGFLVSDHEDRYPDLYREVGAAVADKKIRSEETIVEGLANAPNALTALLHGANTGKMLVHLG